MFVVGVAITWSSWRYFVQTPEGQRLDETAFAGSMIGRSTLWRAAEPVLDVVSIPFVVAVLGATALIAVMRRRWFLAWQVTLLVGGANITTQLLKRVVFDRANLTDDVGAAANSLPSGHTTVAASVAAALVLVVPRRARPAVAILGAGYAAATGISTMVGGWHRPSDVVAALAVVLAWAGLTTALTALGSPERRTSSGPAATRIVAALFVVVAAITAALAVSGLVSTARRLTAEGMVSDRSGLVTAYVGAAFGVVAMTALTFAVVLVSHQLASRATTRKSSRSLARIPNNNENAVNS